MAAPKGNKNALKHGLYAGKSDAVLQGERAVLRDPSFAVQLLEEAIQEIYERMMEARDEESFARNANALSLAATALFNGHRTVAFLTGQFTPMEAAMKELQTLGFEDD